MTNNRPTGQDFFLDSVDLLSQANVHNLVELVSGAALVLVQVLIRALACLRSVARLSDEASATSPVQHLVGGSTNAFSVGIAV